MALCLRSLKPSAFTLSTLSKVNTAGRPASGFGLLDLLITLVIIGIMATAAMPMFHSMAAHTRLQAGSAELATALSYAANLAVRYQRPFGVGYIAEANSFEVFDNRYRLTPTPPANADPPVKAKGVVVDPITKGWYGKDFDELKELAGVIITAAPPGNSVIFYPDGHIGQADAVFTLGYGTLSQTITVQAASGRIRVEGP